MKKLIIICLVVGYAAGSRAQSPADSLQKNLVMIAQSYGDSIVLRWAPTSYHIWSLGNKYGYVLERWHQGLNGYEKIAGPILPYTLKEWKEKTDTTDVTITIAAQVLHGERAVDPTASESMGRKMMAYEEQNNRLGFALLAADFSAAAATALGLRYGDKKLNGHKQFIYRVYIPYADEKIDTARIFVDAGKVYAPSEVKEVTAEGRDHAVEIRWNRPLNDQQFSGYYVEKSSDGKKFTRLNERPFRTDEEIAYGLAHVYNDSLEVNGKDYYYRVVGLTSFGDIGLPSAVAVAKGEDKTPPAPPAVVTSQETKDHKVLINWKTDAKEPDHNGFYVMRSDQLNGTYKMISKELKKNVRSFTDPEPLTFRPNYYKVVAMDEHGNKSESLTSMALLRDDTPPAKPTGLIGEVDSLGIVSLAWNLGGEEDLKGYRVYRANGKDREFVQITKGPIPGNFFTDTVTLRTLSKKVYYKVAAFDFNYNPSAYSDILELERPDYFPPVKPLMKPFKLGTDSVSLDWVPSSSNDIEKHILYKKEKGKEWQELATFSDTTHIFMDTAVIFGHQYTYAVEAVDQGGLRSGKSNEVDVLYRKSPGRQPISGLKGEFNKNEKNFILSWEYKGPAQCKFQIFRGETADALFPYGTVDGGKRLYKDEKLYVNNSGYIYAIKVLHADGTESPMSEPVAVVFKK